MTKIPISQKDEYRSIKEFYEAILGFMPNALLINDCIYGSNILFGCRVHVYVRALSTVTALGLD